MEVQRSNKADTQTSNDPDDELPQCKIKRNYSCSRCSYFTQNPRFHLTHLRDVHGERIAINKCNLCLYASRHYQKLVRHMKMVHGSTEGIASQSRKRAMVEETVGAQQDTKSFSPAALPPLETAVEIVVQNVDLSRALEQSRNTIKDLAVLYGAENEVKDILADMEAADAILLAQIAMEDLTITAKKKPPASSFFEEVRNSSIHEGDLKCLCGHLSKCYSEVFIHRRTCNRKREGHFDPNSEETGSATCQLCAQSFESMEDLLNHQRNCPLYETSQKSTISTLSDFGCGSEQPKTEQGSGRINETTKQSSFLDKTEEEIEVKDGNKAKNILNSVNTEQNVHPQADDLPKHVTKEKETIGASFKKVFKCPRCAFWASTASRFHVHIVGHQNKKPFRCSLCTYRSNWRWDITKHIRIKGIRNPCHKNARVLIADDAECRNYTKYGKYLTMMKMNEEGSDLKLMKTGEMTEEQENKPATEKKLDPTEDGKEKGEDVDGFDGKAVFKCHLCAYRHTNRDAVLVHERIYHPQDHQSVLPRHTSEEELSCQPSSSNMNTVFAAAINLSQTKSAEDPNLSFHEETHKNPDLENSISSTDSVVKVGELVEDDDQSGAPKDSPRPLVSSSKSGIQLASRSSCIGDTRMSKMLKDVITSSNSGKADPERKGLAPFRCGHCHQVSNWKHVIQRHCRLKHSGNIQIEALNRNRDVGTPTYRPIDFTQPRRSQETTVTEQQTPPASDKSNFQLKATAALRPQNSDDLSLNSLAKQSEMSQMSSKPNPSKKQTKTFFREQNEMELNKDAYLLKPSSNKAKASACAVESKIRVRNDEKTALSAVDNKQNSTSQTSSQDPKHSLKKSSLPQEIEFKPPEVGKDCDGDVTQNNRTTDKPCMIRSTTKSAKIQTIKSENSTKNAPSSSTLSTNVMNCPHCPFKNKCPEIFHNHLQHHIRVLNSRAAHICNHCDFSTSSKEEINEHIRLHFESLNNKTLETFSTSFDNLDLTVADNFKKGKKNETIHYKSALKLINEDLMKRNADSMNFRRSKSTQNIEKKSPSNVAEQKTILVNPKTGQVIRRN